MKPISTLIFLSLALHFSCFANQIDLDGFADKAYFTGRGNQLKNIAELVQKSDLPIYITGPGGIGKTQLVKEYIRREKHKFEYILWIDAGQNIPKQIYSILQNEKVDSKNEGQLSLRAVVKLFKKQLSKKKKWIVVFDNVQNVKEVEEFLPTRRSNSQIILITTRDERGFGELIKLKPFSLDEAIKSLRVLFPEACFVTFFQT